MKPMKKYTAWLLCAAMLLQGTPPQLQAAGGPSLEKTKLTLRVGGRAKLRVNGKRIRKCRYRSQNKKIAAVSSKGMVKAKRVGKTKVCVNVTYRRAGQNKKRKLWCRITVKAEKPVRTGRPVGSGGPETTEASQISLASMPPVSATPETTESVERRNPPAETSVPQVSAGVFPPDTTGNPAEIGIPGTEAPVISMPSGAPAPSAAGNDPGITMHPQTTGNPSALPSGTPSPSAVPSPSEETAVPVKTPAPTASPEAYRSLRDGGAIRFSTGFGMDNDIKFGWDKKTSDMFVYCEDSSGKYALITGLNTRGGSQWRKDELIVPAQLDGLQVYAIGEQAIQRGNWQKITIEEGVQEMAVNAIMDCESLTRVSLPSTLELVVANSLPEHRRDTIFSMDYELSEIVIAEGNPWYQVTEQGLYTKDGKNLLYWLPGNPATCAAVASGVACIEPRAFYGNPTLRKLILPDSVKEIGDYAFSGCDKLEELQLPKELSYCGACAFSSCDALKEIRIPEGVEDLGNKVSYCDKLTKIYLPDSMKELSEGIEGCDSLQEIVISDNNPYLEADSTGCYTKGKTQAVFLLRSARMTVYKAPDGLKEIGSSLFEDNTALTEVYLNDVESIGTRAFAGCKNLKKVVFEGNIQKIEAGAFEDCTSLEEFTVPEGIEYLDNILDGCKSLKKVVLPSTLKGFCDGDEKDAIPFYNASAIETIEVSSDNPYMKMVGDALYSEGGKVLLYYCVNASSEVFHVADGTTMIGAGAFRQPDDYYWHVDEEDDAGNGDGNEKQENRIRYALREVYLPDGVQEIRHNAFENCRELRKVSCPDSLLTIRKEAFYCCYGLQELVIGESCGLQEIEASAFGECESLQSITIPESVRTIADAAFDGSSLSTIHYGGTKKEWRQLYDGYFEADEVIIYCKNGTIKE